MPDSPITDPPAVAATEPLLVRPALTLAEAANVCGKSKASIRRSLDAGDFPNASREPTADGSANGRWIVPIDDLIQAGYHPNRYENNAPPVRDLSKELLDEPIRVVRDPPEQIRIDVERFKAEAEKWKAIAGERAQSLEDLRRAMRMLEPARQSMRIPEGMRVVGEEPTGEHIAVALMSHGDAQRHWWNWRRRR